MPAGSCSRSLLSKFQKLNKDSATPHSGTSVASYGSILAKIANTFSPFNPPQAILEALHKNSGILFELTQDFLIKATRLHLISFYEMRMTKIGLWKKMVCSSLSVLSNYHLSDLKDCERTIGGANDA